MSDTLNELKQAVFDQVRLRLGDQMVDVELDPEHYETAYQLALGTYRQRAQAATEESYAFLELQENQNVYKLPSEITQVRQIFRRTMGNATGPYATSFDPFGSAMLNTYVLNASYAGGLATYELYTGYVEQAARMFGGYMNYTFNSVTKELQLVRDPKGTGETIMLWTYNLKPEITVLSDLQISQWIKNFTYAAAKQMIGEAREKFASIAGPQGGTALNGSQLKAEAKAEMDALIDDLRNYVDGSQPLYWVIG